MKKRFLGFFLLFSIFFISLSVNNSFCIFGQKPKEIKEEVKPSAGMSTSESFAQKAAQLKAKQAQRAQKTPQPLLATKKPVTKEEPVKKEPTSIFGKIKRRVTGAAVEVQKKVITEISPEAKVGMGISKVIEENSGKIIDSVVEALRGIKVFPPVMAGISPAVTSFRAELGQRINAFSVGLSKELVNALKAKGAFGSSLEIVTGGAAAFSEKVKAGEEKKGLIGKIKAAISGIFKNKGDVAIGRIQNAVSGCQNDISDNVIRFINMFLKNRFPDASESDLSNLEIYLRGVIYQKFDAFKNSVSIAMVNFLREQGVLK